MSHDQSKTIVIPSALAGRIDAAQLRQLLAEAELRMEHDHVTGHVYVLDARQRKHRDEP